jgi:hypothetical protein
LNNVNAYANHIGYYAEMLEGFVLNNSKIYNNEEKNIFVEEG